MTERDLATIRAELTAAWVDIEIAKARIAEATARFGALVAEQERHG